jgi:hypothetical protein
MDVLTWQQLVREAGSRRVAERLIREGRYWRVVRGAYAPVELPDDMSTRAAAVRAVLPDGAVASRRTALWLLGLDVLRDRLDVTVGRGRALLDREGLRVTSADVSDEDLVLVDGVLCLSAARAFADVAREESLVEAVVVGDAVLRSGASTPELLAAAVASAAGLRGVVRARQVLPHLEGRSESPMESRFRMRLVLGGVPRPQAQFDVYDDDGHAGRGDLHLRGVVLEYDGREARLDKKVFVAERRRQTRIVQTGLELRRFTSDDVYVRPRAAVCAEVLRAVVQATTRDRSRLRTGPDTLPSPRLCPLPSIVQQRAAAARTAA